jgi:hypothetical protein
MDIEKIEQVFELAHKEVENAIVETDETITEVETKDIEKIDKDQVFSFDTLKQDYLIVRQNLIKLIDKGQKILDQVTIMDIGDFKASQLMALSQLQDSIGNNLKLLIDIYKQLTEIKNNLDKKNVEEKDKGNVNVNNAVFVGSSKDLLDMLNGKEVKK